MNIRTLNGLFAIAALAVILLTGPGCSTPLQNTINTERVVITTVDAGMNMWHDYVTIHRSDGKVTQQMIDIVRVDYSRYLSAQIVAKAAILRAKADPSNVVDTSMADRAVNEAKTELLAVLNQFIK